MNIRRIVRYASLLLCLGTAGCGGGCCGCGGPYVSEKTEQGHVLKMIHDEKRQIPTTAPAGLPLEFENIYVDEQVRDKEKFYAAFVTWKRTADEKTLITALGQKLRDKRQDLDDEHLDQFTLFLKYTDVTGKEAYAHTVTIRRNESSSKFTLAELGKKGLPTAGTAELDSITWRLPALTIPIEKKQPFTARVGDKASTPFESSAGGLPIKFELVKTETKDGTQLSLTWEIEGSQEDFVKRLVGLSGEKVDPQKRSPGDLVWKVYYYYRDKQDQPVGGAQSEEVQISLESVSTKGKLPLQQKGSTLLASVELNIVTFTWKERVEYTKMR